MTSHSYRFGIRMLLLALAILATLLGAAPAAMAQTHWSWPEKAKNLKVLPKNTKPEELQGAMTGFTRSLGVRCTFCHVGEEGKPLDTYDFVSDKNPKKDVARAMLKMVGKVNKELASIPMEDEDRVKVGCVTCHHGRPMPRTLGDELTRVYTAGGADSTVARYRALRDRFYGSAAYDFREGSLIEVSNAAIEKKDAKGAIAILNVDAEFFPESGSVHSALGGAYLAAGDTAQAIVHFEKSVALEPRNQMVKRMLDSLKGAPPEVPGNQK